MFSIWIFFGDGEYTSNTNPIEVAREYVKANPQHTPIVVHVIEHAGWFENFFFSKVCPDGLRIGTANDMAVYSPEVEEVWEHLNQIREDSWEYLPEIRRPALAKQRADEENKGSKMEGDRWE